MVNYLLTFFSNFPDKRSQTVKEEVVVDDGDELLIYSHGNNMSQQPLIYDVDDSVNVESVDKDDLGDVESVDEDNLASMYSMCV